VGGLGLVPAANIGESHVVFEAVHGSAPDISGQGIANPTALILSGVLMLRHLGEDAVAGRVLQAVFRVLEEGEVRTPDLGGGSSTEQFADAIVGALTT
jgi:isocitrate dehydrogenase (NAD+)